MLDVILERENAHGLLVAISVPPATDPETLVALLPPEEQVIAAAFGDRRKLTFASGRAVLHHALARLGVAVQGAVLRDDRGAPLFPRGVIGSVSHKESIACALVARAGMGVHIGVDVEKIGAVRPEHGSLILTDAERVRLRGALDLVLALSLKESLYKALDPFVRRYVGFKEVEVFIESDGTARFVLDIDEGPYRAEGTWSEEQGHVITTARVRD